MSTAQNRSLAVVAALVTVALSAPCFAGDIVVTKPIDVSTPRLSSGPGTQGSGGLSDLIQLLRTIIP